jgi:membrane-associated protease RseP (regulator of RpoE activity)
MAFPFVSTSILKSSLLSGSILAWLAPKIVMMPLSQPVPISPLFLVGFVGSVSAALNLLPMYRLDGGRACASAMGSRFAAVASAATLLFLLSISFNPDSLGIAFWWGMAVVFFQRKPDIPARDDVTELDEVRFGAWLASLAASILTLAPFPGGPGIL